MGEGEVMETEAELLAKLDNARARKRELAKYGEAWNEIGLEIARLTEQIRRLRRDAAKGERGNG